MPATSRDSERFKLGGMRQAKVSCFFQKHRVARRDSKFISHSLGRIIHGRSASMNRNGTSFNSLISSGKLVFIHPMQ
jgi:hypothetical protein